MNIEHIEMQMIAALVYLAYALIMLAGNRTAWQKRKTVIIGFTPALLFGLVFVVQYLLEFAYMDTYMPIALTHVFTAFYTNVNLLMLLNGLIAVVYLVLPVSGKFVHEITNASKQNNKYQVYSVDGSIDVLHEEDDCENQYCGYWGTGYGATGYEGTGYRSTGNGG